jgi:UrcA family protein
MTIKPFFTAAFVLASALAPVLALAAPLSDGMVTKVAVVRTSDLNLASAEGQSKLAARITGAVNRVCGTATGSISLEERRAITVCRAKAHNAALALARTREETVLAQR